MSHVVSIKTQVRDAMAVAAACQRLGLPPPQHRCVKLFSNTAEGLAVELPGCWGDQKRLDAFLQAYAAERAKIEARKKGYSVTEQSLQDGSIKLTIQVTGGAA